MQTIQSVRIAQFRPSPVMLADSAIDLKEWMRQHFRLTLKTKIGSSWIAYPSSKQSCYCVFFQSVFRTLHFSVQILGFDLKMGIICSGSVGGLVFFILNFKIILMMQAVWELLVILSPITYILIHDLGFPFHLGNSWKY